MKNSSGDEKVGSAVTLGLLAAWALHDLEELATVPGWWRRNLPALRERYPAVPEAVWRRAGPVDGREFAVAVGAMAAVVASASVAGRLTGGRSAAYQGALGAFGLHGLVHLAQAGLVRGYTPGSATSPLNRDPLHPLGPSPAAPRRCPARHPAARPRRGAGLRGGGDGRGAWGGASADGARRLTEATSARPW